jgi:hypothetical protein
VTQPLNRKRDFGNFQVFPNFAFTFQLVPLQRGSSPDEAGAAGRLDITVDAEITDDAATQPPSTHVVGLYKLNSADPQRESAWFQTLGLSSDFLLYQAFAFKCNLHRYNVESIKKLMFGAAGERPDETRGATSPAAQRRSQSTRTCHPPAARAMGAQVW